MQLKIGPLTNLQDARYAAAVSMSYVSFCLARGNDRKLAASTVWNIANWLEGPELILDMNASSLEEIEGLGVDARYLTFPIADYNASLFNYASGIILLTDSSIPASQIQTLVDEAASAGQELKFEIKLHAAQEAHQYEVVGTHVFLHFPDLTSADTFIAQPPFPVFGIAFGEEAEEEPQVLDYEKLDDIAARFTDVHL